MDLDVPLTPTSNMLITLFSGIPQIRTLDIKFANQPTSIEVLKALSHPSPPLLPQLVRINLRFSSGQILAYFRRSFPIA